MPVDNDGARRPVDATTDHTEMRGALGVQVSRVQDLPVAMRFDSEHDFEAQILKERFAP